MNVFLELCRTGFPAELELVEKAFSRGDVKGGAAVAPHLEGGLIYPRDVGAACGVSPPAHMGYVVVPWLKKAHGGPASAGDRRREVERASRRRRSLSLGHGQEGVYYSPHMGFSVCTVEQCYTDIFDLWGPKPLPSRLGAVAGLHDADKVYVLSGEGAGAYSPRWWFGTRC